MGQLAGDILGTVVYFDLLSFGGSKYSPSICAGVRHKNTWVMDMGINTCMKEPLQHSQHDRVDSPHPRRISVVDGVGLFRLM